MGLSGIRWDQLLAFPFWTLTLYLLRPTVLHEGAWRKPEGLLARLFVGNAALSLTFQMDPVAQAFDRAVGVPNLSWLLAYVLGVATAYCGFSTWTYLKEQHLPRRATPVAIGTIVLLVLAFRPLAGVPEIPHSAAIDTTAQLIFRVILYLFFAFIANEALGVFQQFLRREELPTGRLRIGLLIGALYFALGFTLLRTFDGLALLLNWAAPIAAITWAVANVLIAICILGFALAFAPLRWFRVLARFAMYLEQQATLRDLDKLRRQLVLYTAPLPWAQPKWRERWFQPSYAIYCILIDILDRRSLLLADLSAGNTQVGLPAELSLLLADLPESSDWIALMKYVRQIARGASTSSADGAR
jgi:hypothetical protein